MKNIYLQSTRLLFTALCIFIANVSLLNAQTKLTGILIGHDGSWGDNPKTTIEAGVDGDINTYIDAPQSISYVGYDFGESKSAVLSSVRYVPRETHPQRMVGDQIRGSNEADLTNYDVLYTITEEPLVNVYTEKDIITDKDYRYIYYYSTNSCNLSEIEFYGNISQPTSIIVSKPQSDFSVFAADGEIRITTTAPTFFDVYNISGLKIKSIEITKEAFILCKTGLYIVRDRYSGITKKVLVKN